MGRRQRVLCLVFFALFVGWALVPALKPARSRGAESSAATPQLPCRSEPPLLAIDPCPEPPLDCSLDPPTPAVSIKVRVPAAWKAGREVDYLIMVENRSEAPAHHVTVRNQLPANAKFVEAYPEPHPPSPPLEKGGSGGVELQWLLGTLKPGDFREIRLTLLPSGPDDLKNCVRVQFEHGQCVVTRITGSAPGKGKEKVKEKPAEAKLKLSMTGPKQQYANLPARYFITLTNTGSAKATNVLIANDMPEKMTFVRSSEGGKFLANQVAWFVGTLEAGESRTVDLTLQADAAGELCNKAKALADNNLSAEAEFCTTFQGASALLFEMVGRQNPIDVDGDTSYPILLRNTGQLPLTNIRIKAVIPESMNITRAKGPSDHKLGERTAQGQELVFDALATIPPGQDVAYEVYARGTKAGESRFRVEVQADQLQEGGPVREEEMTIVLPVDGPRPAPAGKQPF